MFMPVMVVMDALVFCVKSTARMEALTAEMGVVVAAHTYPVTLH
jgi:hypothetical protein